MSKFRYVLYQDVNYKSPRYGKSVTMKRGYKSDGASGAIDISGPVYCMDIDTNRILKKSLSWWVHDKLCDRMEWDDGTPCSNRQASMVLRDILKQEGHWVRDYWWFLSTWMFRMIKTRKI
jgi:hypothetical protein